MTDLAEAAIDQPEPPPAPGQSKRKRRKRTSRDEDISGREEIAKKLEKVFEAVEKGFDDQADRADSILDYWDAYNCVLGRYQNYTGGLSQIYVPIIKNAVDALVTRYVNQAFPQSGRHVEVVTGEEEEPHALLSLIEHYIAAGRLRTDAARAILTNGQVEGQYNAYVHWDRIERFVVTRESEPVSGVDALGTVQTVAEETIDDAMPVLEALHDNDVLILPVTSNGPMQALNRGGSVTIVRRWSKSEIEQRMEDGDITEEAGDALLDSMSSESKVRDTAKELGKAAGIYWSGKSAIATIYEVWTKLPVDGNKRLCRAFYAGRRDQTFPALGCKLNPFWSDRCPLLSAAVKKLPGIVKGEAPLAAAHSLQVQANDAANEAGHMLYFSLAPVLAADPGRVSKWKELVSDVAAVWPVDPAAIKMLEWPNKVHEALEVIAFNKATIFETMGVNPSMLPQQTGVRQKRNQAEIAMEQQVDLLQTADAVTVLEEEILTPFVQWMADLDHQFRSDKDMIVREFGELGKQMTMESVPPIQSGNRYRLQWSGVAAARNAAQVQQIIGLMATAMKIPPQLYMGYRLNFAPMLEYAFGQVAPARLARLIFVSMKDEMSVDPKVENQMLGQGFEVHTHAQDNDAEHLQAHMQLPPGPARDGHIARHQLAMRMKQQAMAAQGQQGNPNAGKAGPGPRAGASPAQGPRRLQQPAGAIHPDQMARAGAVEMPRKT